MAILKWLGKIDAPLTKGLLRPFRGDRVLAEGKRCKPDRLYQRSEMTLMHSCKRSASSLRREPP